MKQVKSFLIVLIPFLVLALTGCESTEENSGSFWSEQEGDAAVAEQTQTPAAESTEPAAETADTADDDAGGGEAGVNTFLWKPTSETRGGRAAVLLPANLNASGITVNGEAPAENRGRTNGNRLTYFLSRSGAEYGQNVSVVALSGGTVLRRWTIPNGGSRWTSN